MPASAPAQRPETAPDCPGGCHEFYDGNPCDCPCHADLATFLRARLDEDETAARESHYEGQRWITEEEGVYRWPDDELVHHADRKADARHIAHHDPGRVLREVAAKRAILAEHEPRLARPGDGRWHGLDDRLRCRVCASATEDRWLRFIAPCWTLRQLAAVYSDHPDYQQEWACE